MWLFAILVAVPIIEIALFIQVGGAIGLWPTLAIVIATALAGSLLLRSQGLATMQALQSSVAQGKNPMQPIAHGALILVAGVMLLTPGFFTDFVGFILLLPPSRTLLIRLGAAKLAGRTVVFSRATAGENSQTPAASDIVDADFTVSEESPPIRGNSGWTRPDG